MNVDSLNMRPLDDGEQPTDDEFEVLVPEDKAAAFEAAVREATERLERYAPPKPVKRYAVRPAFFRNCQRGRR